MAVKKTQMYRRNLDGTETNLNPLTESQYVLMENGQTVQEVLSDRDSDKYTPVITNSSSTFKVGQGDNVDLSSSMKEGAYDSCVLKGKTMVNCIQEPSSQDVVLPYAFEDGQYVTINDTKESGALGVELKGQTLVNIHKSTTYSLSRKNEGWYENLVAETNRISFEVTDTSIDGWRYLNLGKLNLDMLKPNTKYLVYFGVANFPHNLGVRFMNGNATDKISNEAMVAQGSNWAILTTSSEIIKSEQVLYVSFTNVLGKVEVGNAMIFEYQDGMENWDIPYFTGMASCKMPTLNSVNQMFDYSLATKPSGSGTVSFTNNGRSLKANFEVTRDCVNVTNITLPAGTYEISYEIRGAVTLPDGASLSSSRAGLSMFKSSQNWYNAASLHVNFANINPTNYTKAKKTITFDESVTVAVVYHGWNNNPVGWCEIKDIRIVPRGKTSILSLPEEVVLRSLPNGICDTFNTRTGIYTQRIGETVLKGGEDERWTLGGWWTPQVETIGFEKPLSAKSESSLTNIMVSGAFDFITFTDVEYIGVSARWECLGIRIARSKLPTENIEGLKTYLSQNPVTVQYELATPIITKISLPSTLKSWNTTTHIYSEIPENSLYPTLSHSNPSYPVILKPSTKYSIVANSYSNSHTNSAINFNLGGATASTTVGNRVTTITTPSTLSNELLTMSGRGNKLSNVMVIEGDVVGDEPYFEGICDCKSPILSNTGKNLINALNCSARMGAIILSKEQNCITFKTPNAWGGLVYHLYLKPNTTYTFSFEGDSVDTRGYVRYKTGMSDWSGGYGGSNKYTFTTDGLGVVMFTIESATVRDSVTVKNIMIEEATTKNLYEPHKSNTTTFDQKDGKTIVLRSLPSGVCDTLNVETGEYVQRIGEIFFDGTNKQWEVLAYPPHNNNTHYQFKHQLGEGVIGGGLWANAQSILSNTLPSANESLHWGGNGNYGIGGDGNSIMITWKKDVSPFNDIATLNAWLKKNPTIVQYELATPIVSTIDIQGFPYAYKDGHVQLSSGSIEQSLTPTVEYSLSANKTGQINSNTKRVSAHQKQLDDFEAMMLTQMVQSAYDKAILQFDYEMQMMSLGGE